MVRVVTERLKHFFQLIIRYVKIYGDSGLNASLVKDKMVNGLENG